MSMRLRERVWWMRYGVAVLSVALAAGVVALVEHTTSVAPFLLFVLAASASAAYGGAGPGLLAVLLACLASDFLFLPPLYVLVLDGRTAYLGGIYLLGGLFSYATSCRSASGRSQAGRVTAPPPGWPGGEVGRHEHNGSRP
jgi:K+-sensing histidine kinase KdpD